MKKLILIVPALAVITLFATPLKDRFKVIKRGLSVISKSDEELWKEVHAIDKRVGEIEKYISVPKQEKSK